MLPWSGLILRQHPLIPGLNPSPAPSTKPVAAVPLHSLARPLPFTPAPPSLPLPFHPATTRSRSI